MSSSKLAQQSNGETFDQPNPQLSWPDVVAKYRSSGITQKQFCQEHGIAYTTFKNWVYRTKESTDSTSEAEIGSFVPVKTQVSFSSTFESAEISAPGKFVNDIPLSPKLSAPDLQIQLPQGYAIVVPRGFDADTLRRVIKAVSES